MASAIVGCAGDTKIDVVPVKGTVTLDGAPASGVAISFIPQEGAESTRGHARSDDEGRFVAKVDAENAGLAPGKYRVLFTKMVLPDGSPLPPDAMAADAGAENALHRVYSDPGTSPVFVTIGDGGEEDLPLEIQSRPRY